jgi:hypothetical protein
MTDHDGGTTATVYRFAGHEYDTPQALAAGFAELGYPLNEQGLASLAAAVASGTPSHLSMDALSSAYRGRLLAAYGDATGQTRFREIDDRWHDDVDAWGEQVRDAVAAGGPDVYGRQAWRARAWLLQAILRPEAEQAIRERAEAATKSPAALRPWFRGVDDPKNGPVGSALAAAMLADAAPDHYEPPAPNKTKRVVKWGVLAAVILGLGYLAFTVVGPGEDESTPQADQTTGGPDQSGKGTGNRVQFTGVANVATTLRETPEASGVTVADVEQFTVLEVMELEGDWYGVRIKETPDTFGYVEKAQVDIRCEGKCQIG